MTSRSRDWIERSYLDDRFEETVAERVYSMQISRVLVEDDD